jgi:hypothetical protein
MNALRSVSTTNHIQLFRTLEEDECWPTNSDYLVRTWVKPEDSHRSDFVFCGDSVCHIDVALQKVNVRVLIGESLKHWGNLVARPTPGSFQGDSET